VCFVGLKDIASPSIDSIMEKMVFASSLLASLAVVSKREQHSVALAFQCAVDGQPNVIGGL